MALSSSVTSSARRDSLSHMGALVACAVLICLGCGGAAPEPVVASGPWDNVSGNRAFGYLEKVCAIGPRISGTEGMQQQQELLQSHFEGLGAQVRYQGFDVAHPETGMPVRLQNMIVSWHPDAKQRVLLCCHYDTRPWPDRELLPHNRRKPFIGANDGGSGVALLMELGHHMASLKPRYGVDFVFFDAEELIYNSRRDKYFLGSEHFAQQYRDNPPGYRYEYGVLLDMVGDRDFKVYYERNSLKYARDVTQSVWSAARAVGVREFVARAKHEVRDDHLPLNQIARIPTCDVIDFDYPYWHKRNDLPAACSPQTLQKVGRVMVYWLENLPAATGSRGR
ncbi:M28 family peptidase [Maioricimonas sp. JC845]|uniref:M28 family peptidase n=1 Tax=Maioricimonas sp. JC845 TaxID=3232138 RepID=UPI003459870C